MSLDVITSPLLAGTKHGFFGRAGGASSGVFAGLNCGYGSSDQHEAVTINRSRAAKHLGVHPDHLVGPADHPETADRFAIVVHSETADCFETADRFEIADRPSSRLASHFATEIRTEHLVGPSLHLIRMIRLPAVGFLPRYSFDCRLVSIVHLTLIFLRPFGRRNLGGSWEFDQSH